MKKQYTFNNLINGREYDYENFEWIDTPLQERQEALHQFRTFLLKTTREGSRPQNALLNMDVVRCLPETAGIFDRLIISERGVEYIAGQDYTGEIKFIKDLIVKHCY